MKRSLFLMGLMILFAREALALPHRACGFSEIIQRAYEKEHLNWESLEIERKKMGKAPWLPSLSIGYDRVIKETNSVDLNDNISVSSGGVFVGPDDSNLTQSINAGDQLRFRAIWRLDQLIYPDSRINLLNLERHLFKDRQALSDDLFKVYLEREKTISQIQSHAAPSKDGISLKRKLRALNERLNAQTDGLMDQCNKERTMKKNILMIFLLLVSCSPKLDFEEPETLDSTMEASADAAGKETPPSSQVPESSHESTPALLNAPDLLVIHEILFDPDGDEADGNTFIELYGTPLADLAGYSIEIIDGAMGKVAKTILFNTDHRLNDQGLFLICEANTGVQDSSHISNCGLIINFDLQNGPDALKLLNPQGNTLDQICYGFESTPNIDGLCEGASAADTPEGMSLSRTEGLDTNDNFHDFHVNTQPSAGSLALTPPKEEDASETHNDAPFNPNVSEETEESEKPVEHPLDAAPIPESELSSIIISEVVTDPQHDWNDSLGGDGIPFNVVFGNGTIGTSDEWVELINVSNNIVNLENWSLVFKDGTDETFLFTDGTDAVLFSDDSSASSFNNQERLVVTNPPGDMKNTINILLYDDESELVDEVSIEDGNANSIEDESIIFDEAGNLSRDAASILF